MVEPALVHDENPTGNDGSPVEEEEEEEENSFTASDRFNEDTWFMTEVDKITV